jgi:hypothetical protein
MTESIKREDLQPRVDTNTCARCRKRIKPGDRISMCHIVEREGSDMANIGRKGLYLMDCFEFVHVDCKNTGMKPK